MTFQTKCNMACRFSNEIDFWPRYSPRHSMPGMRAAPGEIRVS
jgi:hypothetical protein